MTDAVLSTRERTISLGAVILATFGIGIFMGTTLPLIALILERWGVSGTVIGLNSAMPALGVLILGPFMGAIVRRLGAMRAMLGGMAVGSLSVLLMPVLPNLWVWFLLRFAMGCGLALPWLVGETWINAVATNAMRARVIGIYSASLFGGMALGPLIVQATGTQGFLPFLPAIAALVLAAAPLMAAWRLAPDITGTPSLRLGQVVWSAPTVAGAALVAGLSESAFFSLLPVYGLRAGLAQEPALTLLTVLIVGAIVLQYPVGWLADRMDKRQLLALMASATAILAPLLIFVIEIQALTWALLFVLGGLALGYYTVGLALLGARFGPAELAVANTAFIVLYEAGTIGGPALSGMAMDLWEPHGFAVTVAAFGLGYALLAARRYWRAP